MTLQHVGVCLIPVARRSRTKSQFAELRQIYEEFTLGITPA
jgi:hypothetical protein